MDDGLAAMCEADIVVSSTGCPETILDREDVEAVMRQRPNRPLFLIDIAVPRDIAADVEHLENVFLYNIDHLERLVAENVRMREQELARCHEIIEEHTAAVDGQTQRARRETGSAPAAGAAMAGLSRVPWWVMPNNFYHLNHLTILTGGHQRFSGIGTGCQDAMRHDATHKYPR